ncbi:porin [Rheinheimera tilapiae]|uniref:Porin n=1 Tax=Rheinheimera tilapiae TaxID=875043 RepID=A0ABV6BIL5_9GAMM
MHKPLLLTVAGLVAGVASPLQANDFNWDFYGKLDVQALYADANLLRYADEGWQIEAPFSRLGFKADQALTDDLKLIAVYEWQVNGLDDSNKGHRFGSRNTYIGLASNSYGELIFGKNDSKFKKSEGKIDLFNETLADMAQLAPGQDRLENIVSYQSPKLGLWQWSATYQTGASDETAGGYDWSLSYGDAAFKQAPYYLAYARANELNNISADRLLAHALLHESTLGTLSGGLMWQHSEHQTKPLKGNAWLAELQLKRDTIAYKLQFMQDHSRTRHSEEGYSWSVGADYSLSKDLTAYLIGTQLKLETQHDSAAAVGIKWVF